MNIRLLKILVIFMAFLIVIGFSILIKTLYNKTNNLAKSKKENSKNIIINQQNNMQLKSRNIENNLIILEYEDKIKLKFLIIDINNGNILKEIDVLK